MPRRATTDWDSYTNIDPSNPFVRKLFLDAMFKAYHRLLRNGSFDGPVSILELGSGTGYITQRICRLLPTRSVTLVDSNEKMLGIAQQTLASVDCEKHFIHSDFFEVDLDEGFDLVHSAGVVEHFEKSRRAELLRLHASSLQDGGYCIVYAPTPTPAYRFWRDVAEAFDIWPYHDEVPMPREQLVREVEAVGLQVLSVNTFWDHFLTEVGLIASK